MKEKETATLQCEVPVSHTKASWFMEETRLEQSTKYRMDAEGTLRRLTIHNVTTNDDAVYICEMKEGSRTVAELTVLGKIFERKPVITIPIWFILFARMMMNCVMSSCDFFLHFQATSLKSCRGGQWCRLAIL